MAKRISGRIVRRSQVSGRVLSKFPARVLATDGLSISRSNGIYTFSIDMSDVTGAGTLTGTSDTNVGLTIGGAPSHSLFSDVSLTLSWSGTLAATRGGWGTDIGSQSGVPLFATGVPTFTSTIGTGNFVRATSPTIATPTITTSAVAPLVIGGSAASSTLTLESTSGAGTTDKVIVKTGAQVTSAYWETPRTTGAVVDLDTQHMQPGSGYVNGTYNNVALTGGVGTGALANIVVSGGVVTAVTLVNGGSSYAIGNNLSAAAASLGGSGSGFLIPAGVGNSYIPNTGSPIGQFAMDVGDGRNIRSIPGLDYDIPGISPWPPAGLMFLTGQYNDNTPGNISNLYSVSINHGRRYCAAITGVGYVPTSAVETYAWGGQFSVVIDSGSQSISSAINCEVDWHENATGTFNCLQLKMGTINGGTATTPGNSYIQSVSFGANSAPIYGWRFQANDISPINSAGSIIGIEGIHFSCTNGIDLTGGAFSGSPFKSTGFSVDPDGDTVVKTVNGLTVTSTTGALTIANGKTVTASNTLTLAGTDSTTITFQGTDTYVGRATTDTLTNKTLTTPTINQPNIAGTTTNNDAAAGSVGQLISATVLAASEASLTTATGLTVTSISLTAGDWDVAIVGHFDFGASTTVTNYYVSASTTTNTMDFTAGNFSGIALGGIVCGSSGNVATLPSVRFSLASTTTVYFVAYSTFGISTAKVYGTIRARRVR